MEVRSVADLGRDFQFSMHLTHSLLDADEPQASAGNCSRIKANAVITNNQRQLVGISLQPHLNRSSLRVLCAVRQGLLNDSVDACGVQVGKPLEISLDIDAYQHAAASRKLASLPLESWSQPEVIQD